MKRVPEARRVNLLLLSFLPLLFFSKRCAVEERLVVCLWCVWWCGENRSHALGGVLSCRTAVDLSVPAARALRVEVSLLLFFSEVWWAHFELVAAVSAENVLRASAERHVVIVRSFPFHRRDLCARTKSLIVERG